MMKNRLEKLLNKLKNKIINCPSCKQQLRIPIKPGKTLEIRCSKCCLTFQIGFQTPFQNIFKWNRNHSLKSNLQSFWYKLTLLPGFIKFALYMFFIMFIIIAANSCPHHYSSKKQVEKSINKIIPIAYIKVFKRSMLNRYKFNG